MTTEAARAALLQGGVHPVLELLLHNKVEQVQLHALRIMQALADDEQGQQVLTTLTLTRTLTLTLTLAPTPTPTHNPKPRRSTRRARASGSRDSPPRATPPYARPSVAPCAPSRRRRARRELSWRRALSRPS